jgi:hypothetical protein
MKVGCKPTLVAHSQSAAEAALVEIAKHAGHTIESKAVEVDPSD